MGADLLGKINTHLMIRSLSLHIYIYNMHCIKKKHLTVGNLIRLRLPFLFCFFLPLRLTSGRAELVLLVINGGGGIEGRSDFDSMLFGDFLANGLTLNRG